MTISPEVSPVRQAAEIARPVPLLASEYLGPLALEPAISPSKNTPRSLWGGATFYGELAIAQQNPALLDISRGFLERVPLWRPDAKTADEAALFNIYLPAFYRRAEGAVPDGDPWKEIHKEVIARIGGLVDERGYPLKSSGGFEGHLGELIALVLIENSYPAFPREEASPDSRFNHDCSQWENGTKVPVQVKHQAVGDHKRPHYDRRVFVLNLGSRLFWRLEDPYFTHIMRDYPEFKRSEEAGYRAAFAIMARTLVRMGNECETPHERRFYATTRREITRKIRAHGKREKLDELR
jgi:hypothetical protein